MVEHLTIRDKLNQLKDITKEISEIEAKIAKLEKDGYGLAAIQESYKRPPFTKHDIIIEAQTKKTREQISFFKSMLQERLDSLLKVKIETEKYISELPTSRLRRIFEHKYIDQYTFRKIAYIIGGNATEESIRKEHDRFLKKS